MNRSITVVVALMVVVSVLIVATIINSGPLIPQTGQPELPSPAHPHPILPALAGALAHLCPIRPTAACRRSIQTGQPRQRDVLQAAHDRLHPPRWRGAQNLHPAPAPGPASPEKWQQWPIIPTVSERARAIYRDGLKRGTNPQHFSKIGDCQVIRQYFLGLFDDDPDGRLGTSPYKNLLPTIKSFAGNWGRVSMAVRTGFNVASVLSPINSDPKQCTGSETPLQCEFRLWNPAIVVISMETWPTDRPTNLYEGYLRQIVEYAIARGALPILATKADNLEKDHSINLAVARVAFDYDIPLWNFWRAATVLPNQGLLEDGFHLTNAHA